MNAELIEYASLAVGFEWHRVGEVIFVSAETWHRRFLADPTVDPLNVHKPYGLTAPQYVNGKWYLGFCLDEWLRPIEDPEDFDTWMQYWVAHAGLHIVVKDWAINLGEHYSLEEEEARVDQELQTQAPALHRSGEALKQLVKE